MKPSFYACWVSRKAGALLYASCLALAVCALRPEAVSSAHDAAIAPMCGEHCEGAVIEVLFAKNQYGALEPGCDRALCQRLRALIRSAEWSVDFAIYGIRNQNAVIDALVEAQVRGVRVRGVVDTEGELCDKFSYLNTNLLWQ